MLIFNQGGRFLFYKTHSIECNNCGYGNSICLGIGMMYSSLERVISLVSPKRREQVLTILHRQDVHDVRYEHKIFICPRCNMLTGRFDFSIAYNDGQVYKPYFRCPECRTKLIALEEPIDEHIRKIPCPECGKKSLTYLVEILWD